MSIELIRKDIREQLKSLKVDEKVHYDINNTQKVKQVASMLNTNTELNFTTSTTDPNYPDKLVVRRRK